MASSGILTMLYMVVILYYTAIDESWGIGVVKCKYCCRLPKPYYSGSFLLLISNSLFCSLNQSPCKIILSEIQMLNDQELPEIVKSC